MKCFIPVLVSALITAGCSPKGESSPRPAPVAAAADLGKAERHFRNLYGAPKSEKRVADYAFSLPAHGSMIRLIRPLLVQQYESDQLKVTVLYSETARPAIWVNYTLPNPWTQEQISAALQAYGSDWKIVQENLGMNFILQAKAPVAYRSSADTLAYKTMMNELMVYAPPLHADLRGQIAEADRAKKAVPKF